ncbi:MAG: putative membrane protein [Burkholderiaceae bacterium]|nr:MAG: putative membrane protein [Burkholderiaceae bacterium]
MIYHAAADLVLLLHLAFIAFALAGALLVLRWRWLAWLQLPAAAWGIFIELSGRICPLTTVENALRVAAGQAGYADGFVAHYLLALIYPSGLTRQSQFVLAGVVLAVNAGVYAWLLWRRRPSPRAG